MIAKAKNIKDGVLKLAQDIRTIVMVLAIVFGGGSYKVAQAIWPDSPTHEIHEHADHEAGPVTPLACARAMQDMAVSLGALKAVVEEQGKRLDRFEVKIDHINDRLDYRLADKRSR